MPSYLSYKRQMAVLDADDNEIESWITVRGNHIPIKKGQSKEDAVKSFIAGKKKNLVENHNSLVEAMNLEEKGYFKKDPKKRDSITQSAIEMGKEEKNLEELMEFGVKEGNAAKPKKKRETYTTAEGFEFYKDTNEPVKKGGYTLADKKGNIILQANFVDNTKPHNEKGLYQDALNELDDQIAEKEKELENIHSSMTENAGAGYFDIASANMEDIEFVKGQLNELKKKREKLAGSGGNKGSTSKKKKEPAIVRKGGVNWVDEKKWNDPRSDPWYALYE